jgi:hypothetical protein
MEILVRVEVDVVMGVILMDLSIGSNVGEWMKLNI